MLCYAMLCYEAIDRGVITSVRHEPIIICRGLLSCLQCFNFCPNPQEMLARHSVLPRESGFSPVRSARRETRTGHGK